MSTFLSTENSIKTISYELPGPIVLLNLRRHTSTCAKGVRELITYGALINHSCDPNCYIDLTYSGLKQGQPAAVIALRDIQINEEITVNYNLFAYDMKGKQFILFIPCLNRLNKIQARHAPLSVN
jgi:SET domain-containing protein